MWVQTNREDFRQVDRSLNDSRDIVSRFRHVPEAIANTVKIADRVNIEIPLNQWHFAAIDLPERKTADQILREQAEASLLDYYDPVTPDVRERLEKELGIIITKATRLTSFVLRTSYGMPKTMASSKPRAVRPPVHWFRMCWGLPRSIRFVLTFLLNDS